MTRGQSEYIGALVVVSLTVLLAYLAGEWISAIGSIGRNAVEAVERSREVLDVYMGRGYIAVGNRGVSRSLIDYVYVKLGNGSLLISRAGIDVGGGGSKRIEVDTSSAEKVCVETSNGNTFCSRRDLYEVNSVYEGFWSYERVPPTYVSDSTALYRAMRVVPPDTYFYVYAVPKENAVAVWSGDDLLHRLPVYIDRAPEAVEGGYILIVKSRHPNIKNIVWIESLFDFNDGTYTRFESSWSGIGTYVLYDIFIDLGNITAGWLYLKTVVAGHEYLYIRLSNNSCRHFTADREIRISCNLDSCAVKPLRIPSCRCIEIASYYTNLNQQITGVVKYVHSLEFYPIEWRSALTFRSAEFQEPIGTTISVFALGNTYIQMIELVKLPSTNNDTIS